VVSDLQDLYAAAVAAASGDDPMSVLKRASLDALAASVPEVRPESTQPALYLRLAEIGAVDHAVPMQEAGEFLGRVQRAVARVAKARRNRVLLVERLRREDFVVARLDVAAAAPGSLVVKIQPHLQPAQDGEIPLGGTTWAELALIDILTALPESEGDDASVEAILAGSPILRRAVADLVVGRRGELLDVSFDLRRASGETITSRLTPNHTIALRRTLSAPTEERFVERRVGVLDGVRTRRRLFYFRVENEPEIHGLIQEELVDAVKANLDRRVEVTLEVVTTRSKGGKRGARSYLLLDIQPAQTDPLPST
jgi:hypothetical protein